MIDEREIVINSQKIGNVENLNAKINVNLNTNKLFLETN